MSQNSRGTSVCGRLAPHEGFDPLNRRKREPLPGPKPGDELVTAHRLNSKVAGTHARGSEKTLDPGNNRLPNIHSPTVGQASPTVKDKLRPWKDSLVSGKIWPMFKELIRKALDEADVKPRRAALEMALMNEGWLKNVLKGTEPTIGGIARLALELKMDLHELLEAAAHDFPPASGRRTRRVQAAIEAVSRMSPAEKKALEAALAADRS